jgi:hypothetical protein
MKEKEVNIEAFFASKLRSFEMDVPDAVWSQLSNKLQTEKEAAFPKRLSNKKVLWWSLSAVASLLLLLFVLNHQEGTGDSPINKLEDEAKNIARQARIRESRPTENYAKNEPLVYASKKNQRKSLSSGSISLTSPSQKTRDEILPEHIDISQEYRDGNAMPEKVIVVDGKKLDPELERKTDGFSNAAKDAADRLFGDTEVAKQKKRHKIGLTAAGGLGLSSQTKTANQLLSLNDYSQSASALRSGSFMSTQGMTSSSNSTYQLEHSWPVSFSIGVTKPLTSFLSLELGISYSYLYSTQKGKSNASMRQSQQFSYIGLPMGLNFRVATWRHFRLGILVGGSIQKDISGRLKQEIKAASSYEDYSTKNIHQKYIQPSLNSNIHISYSIGEKLSLFGKLGGAYYFDMNDRYSTIYSDKNFLPDVGFGLSYNLEY